MLAAVARSPSVPLGALRPLPQSAMQESSCNATTSGTSSPMQPCLKPERHIQVNGNDAARPIGDSKCDQVIGKARRAESMDGTRV